MRASIRVKLVERDLTIVILWQLLEMTAKISPLNPFGMD